MTLIKAVSLERTFFGPVISLSNFFFYNSIGQVMAIYYWKSVLESITYNNSSTKIKEKTALFERAIMQYPIGSVLFQSKEPGYPHSKERDRAAVPICSPVHTTTRGIAADCAHLASHRNAMDAAPAHQAAEASDPDEHEERALRELTSIAFSGVLRDASNPNNALAALGGADAVRATVSAIAMLRDPSNANALFSNTAAVDPDTVLRRSPPRPARDIPPLTLALRPGEGSSPSNVGSAHPEPLRRSFAVRVMMLPENTELKAADGISRADSAAPKREHTVLLGRVTHVVRFPGISDWQYIGDESLMTAQRALSMRTSRSPVDFTDAPDRRGALKRSRGGDDAWRAADARETRTRRALALGALVREGNIVNADVLELCRPWRFSRTAIEISGADYAFRQHVHAEDGERADRAGFRIGRDRRSDRDRLATLSWKVSPDATSVPSAPSAAVSTVPVRRREARAALIAALRANFEERPVWTRRSVVKRVSAVLRGAFAPAIRHVAYSFYGAGPFVQAWIRYGYDPRSKREARRWQVVEVRCKNPVVVEAVKLQYARVKAPLPERARMHAWEADFSLDAIPTNRNLFVQLADIRMESVQSLLEEEAYREKFSPKTGFFTDEGYARVHEAIRKGLYEMARSLLGEQRADEILQECLRRRRRRRLQPRSVLDPKFRGRLATSRPPRKWKNAASAAALEHTGDAPVGDDGAQADGADEGAEAVVARETEIPSDSIQKEVDVDAARDENGAEGVEEVDTLLAGTVHPKFMNFEEVEGFEIIDDDDGGDDDMDDCYDDEEEEEEEGGGANAVMGDDGDDNDGGEDY